MLLLTSRSGQYLLPAEVFGLMLPSATPNHLPAATILSPPPRLPARNFCAFLLPHLLYHGLGPIYPKLQDPHRNLASTVEPSANTSSPVFPRQASSAFYPHAPNSETPFPVSRGPRGSGSPHCAFAPASRVAQGASSTPPITSLNLCHLNSSCRETSPPLHPQQNLPKHAVSHQSALGSFYWLP